MGESAKPRFVLAFTFPTAALVALASGLGIFWAGTYARETAYYAAQGVGQDAVNLIVVLPALLISALLAARGSRLSFQVWGGVVFYCVYSYVIYTFGMHFGPLFLVYCAILGFSVYALIYYFRVCGTRAADWYDEKIPAKAVSGFLVLISVAFYVLWLSEDIPALINGTVPKSIVESGLITNAVHVLDLSVVLPALLIAAAALWRRRSIGYALAPIALGFVVLMSLALAGMMLAMKLRGLSADLGLPIIFGVLALVSLAFLAALFRHVKKSS